jgi:hypothetical protein
VERITRSRVTLQPEPMCHASGGTKHISRGSPGTRTRNLRIKSPIRRCWSERCVPFELRVCVSVVPIVSRRFPILHGMRRGRHYPGRCHRSHTARVRLHLALMLFLVVCSASL